MGPVGVSEVRALKAVCVDIPVTVTHMEQGISEPY